MKISSLTIRNFKSIRELNIENIENALILVGKNNTGKTVVIDAIRVVSGSYQVTELDFNDRKKNIEIQMTLEITEEDLIQLHGLACGDMVDHDTITDRINGHKSSYLPR